jgi:hypothetical protein
MMMIKNDSGRIRWAAILSLCMAIVLRCSSPIGAATSDFVSNSAAQLVASNYLPRYYPGDWVPFVHSTYYGLDGEPAAHAFVFRSRDSQITSSKELEVVISEAQLARETLRLSAKELEDTKIYSEEDKRIKRDALLAAIKRENSRIYQFHDFATVITGAKNTDPLVVRCFRGLPPALAEKNSLQKELDTYYKHLNLVLRRVIYLNEMDIRYESLPSKGLPNLEQQSPVSDDSFLISEQDRSLTQVSTIRQKIQRGKAEKERLLSGMKEEDRTRYQQGLDNTKTRNRARWNEYEEKARGGN